MRAALLLKLDPKGRMPFYGEGSKFKTERVLLSLMVGLLGDFYLLARIAGLPGTFKNDSSLSVMGCSVSAPQRPNLHAEVLPVPQNMALFGNKVNADVMS